MRPCSIPLNASVEDSSPITLSGIISALSFALDLTEGAVAGHALRTCLLGMRLAAEAGISTVERRSLYYALLLKDAGCSSNAARMCQILGGGDDRAVKAGVKLETWTKPHKPKLSTFRLLWKTVSPEANAWERMARIGQIGLMQHRNNEEMIALRCDRGASILRKLSMGHAAAEAVRALDEHWDGSGYPERRRGEAIPLLGRICAVAQHLDVFATKHGAAKGLAVLCERSGHWFDPELVRIACSLDREGRLWSEPHIEGVLEETRRAVLAIAPSEAANLHASEIDNICAAFAEVVDAKSPFTFQHSVGVAEAADRIAEEMGLAADRQRLVHRASLLHDLGKLSVPNSILDKPGKLTAGEWAVVQGHPGLSRQILRLLPGFAEVAAVAGEHHERLDGTGYPDRIMGDDLRLESRILSVADVYGALAEERPYRVALEVEQTLDIMEKLVPHQLDGDCFRALVRVLSGHVEQASAQSLPPKLPLFPQVGGTSVLVFG